MTPSVCSVTDTPAILNDPTCRFAKRNPFHQCHDAHGQLWSRPGVGPRPGSHCVDEMGAVLRDQREAAFDPTCADCVAHKGQPFPSHSGSTLCRMGTSIAAGGTKTHCTCEACH